MEELGPLARALSRYHDGSLRKADRHLLALREILPIMLMFTTGVGLFACMIGARNRVNLILPTSILSAIGIAFSYGLYRYRLARPTKDIQIAPSASRGRPQFSHQAAICASASVAAGFSVLGAGLGLRPSPPHDSNIASAMLLGGLITGLAAGALVYFYSEAAFIDVERSKPATGAGFGGIIGFILILSIVDLIESARKQPWNEAFANWIWVTGPLMAALVVGAIVFRLLAPAEARRRITF